MNRNTKQQLSSVHLICADRNDLGESLRGHDFDAVIDVCGYNQDDVRNLLGSLKRLTTYVFISSSAVYPETNEQPFTESQRTGANSIWGAYGMNKVEAENFLLRRCPDAYILRPPYLYGPMQNVYREPFVFECALQGRKFYIPKEGKMKLQFCHVEDLCRVIEAILKDHPREHIFNVGNKESVDINTFVAMCYEVAGADLKSVYVNDHHNQRDYFSFYDYEYELDVSKQSGLLLYTKPLKVGLRESFEWYVQHPEVVNRKEYIAYIDEHLA